VPWATLRYNVLREACEIDITDEKLRDAPSCVGDREFDWGDRSQEIAVHKVYRTTHYRG